MNTTAVDGEEAGIKEAGASEGGSPQPDSQGHTPTADVHTNDVSGFGLDQPDIWGIEGGSDSEQSPADSDDEGFVNGESPSELWGDHEKTSPTNMGDSNDTEVGDPKMENEKQSDETNGVQNNKDKTSSNNSPTKKAKLKRQNSNTNVRPTNWRKLAKGRQKVVECLNGVQNGENKKAGSTKTSKSPKQGTKKTSPTGEDAASGSDEAGESETNDADEKNDRNKKGTASKNKLRVPVRASSASDSGSDEEAAEIRPAKPVINQAWVRAIRKLDMVLPLSSSREADKEDGETVELQMNRILTNIKAEMETAGIEDLTPTVNGMRQFGVSKGIITRAVVNFLEPPKECPLTVCFHFPNNFLNHSYVRHMVLSRIRQVPGGKVLMIQFQDRNVFHGTRCIDNRWIIKVSNKMAFEVLLRTGIDVCNRRIAMRPYTDVLKDEYAEYKEYVDLQKKYVYNKIKTLADDSIPERTLTLIKEVADEVYQNEAGETGENNGESSFRNTAFNPPQVIIEEEDDIPQEESSSSDEEVYPSPRLPVPGLSPRHEPLPPINHS